MNNQPVGSVEPGPPHDIEGHPNVVRLAAGTKSFLFDPVAKKVVFHMLTNAGRSVDLQLPLDKPAPDGRYFLVFAWDNTKGASLAVNDKWVGDGL